MKDWRLLHTLGQGEGHKIFQCLETGKIAVADHSGRFPEDTDDGLLWLDKERPIQVSYDHSMRPYGRDVILVPVLCERTGKGSVVGEDVQSALWLAANFGFRIQTEDYGDVEVLPGRPDFNQAKVTKPWGVEEEVFPPGRPICDFCGDLAAGG